MSAHSTLETGRKVFGLIKPWKQATLRFNFTNEPRNYEQARQLFYEEQEYILPFEDHYLLVKFERNLILPTENHPDFKDDKPLCYVTGYRTEGKFSTVQANNYVTLSRFLERLDQNQVFDFEIGEEVVYRENDAPVFAKVKAVHHITKESEVEYVILVNETSELKNIWGEDLISKSVYTPEDHISFVAVEQLLEDFTSAVNKEDFTPHVMQVSNIFFNFKNEEKRLTEIQKTTTEYFQDYQKQSLEKGNIYFSDISKESLEYFAQQVFKHYQRVFDPNSTNDSKKNNEPS